MAQPLEYTSDKIAVFCGDSAAGTLRYAEFGWKISELYGGRPGSLTAVGCFLDNVSLVVHLPFADWSDLGDPHERFCAENAKKEIGKYVFSFADAVRYATADEPTCPAETAIWRSALHSLLDKYETAVPDEAKPVVAIELAAGA
jgi:hypothetical protein